ncbi:NAD(P)H-dependent flavin oxidoreductase, partial [Lacticaseibacillus paracasei]
IGSGHAPASWVKEQIDIAKSLTDKAFGVNVMLLSPFVEQVIDVIVDAKVALVTTGAGDPSRYLERLQQNGTIVMPVVPSVAMAKRMAKD